jgi:uncharacterized protein
MVDIQKIQTHVLNKLEAHLPSYLTYHNIFHTTDVLEQSLILAKEEGIESAEDLFLLQVSALYHDVGFVQAYDGHEETSCEIAAIELDKFGLDERQIGIVSGMIRATRIPQSPKTILEQVICDADLDYLGRSDFYTIGEGLFKEFLHQGIVHNDMEWNQLQIKFLDAHRYFTKSANVKRELVKQQHLREVKKKVLVG